MNKLELVSTIIPRALSVLTKLGAGAGLVSAGISASKGDAPSAITCAKAAAACMAASFACDIIIQIQKKTKG
jgi:hypothetical protein